jgi:hypothetical protein
VGDDDVGGRGAGVAGHVGEGLLDDPVGGQVDGGRQRPGGTGPVHDHLDAGRPGRHHQGVDLGQARDRRVGRSVT